MLLPHATWRASEGFFVRALQACVHYDVDTEADQYLWNRNVGTIETAANSKLETIPPTETLIQYQGPYW
jgi:hypothetical protein